MDVGVGDGGAFGGTGGGLDSGIDERLDRLLGCDEADEADVEEVKEDREERLSDDVATLSRVSSSCLIEIARARLLDLLDGVANLLFFGRLKPKEEVDSVPDVSAPDNCAYDSAPESYACA